jgi:hypothetical protein
MNDGVIIKQNSPLIIPSEGCTRNLVIRLVKRIASNEHTTY